jgi:hypothetical protein
MSQVFKAGDRLVLELGEHVGEQSEQSGRGFDFQLLSPLLLGLLAPFIIANYYEPETLSHLKWPIWIFLMAMFVVCTALFFYTHHFPGRINKIVIDREARTIEIVWRNLMAQASQIVPFQDISALRVRQDYDDDGRPSPIAELVLRTRPPIRLPANLTEEQLRPLRASIGLG